MSDIKSHRFSVFILLFVIGLAACTLYPASQSFSTAWQPDDLRALEAPGAVDPNHDLIAAYARLTDTDLELRFDLLGSPGPFDYDLYVVVDSVPGGGGRLPVDTSTSLSWDIAFGFPAKGLPRAFQPVGTLIDIRPRILRDSVQDTAIVRVSLAELALAGQSDPRQCSFQAFLVRPGETRVQDSIGPLPVNGSPPSMRAPLVLVFWNSFPSATPAQALRRWSGAHTGPYGQRHGLSVLLQASSLSGIPVAVLDLKRAEQLSALEMVGGLPLIRQLVKENLLLLPDWIYGDPQSATTSLHDSSAAGQRFGLPASRFLYGPPNQSPPRNYQAAFARFSNPSHLRKWGTLRLIPLPDSRGEENDQEAERASEAALAVADRIALLNVALSPDPDDLVVLGGDLPQSPWGDSLIAGPAFQYIAGHPWIQALNGNDLLNFPAAIGLPECPDLLCLPNPEVTPLHQSEIRKALQDAPAGLFRNLAWQTYLDITEPSPDPRLQALRAQYLGQVGPLLAGANWNASPTDQSRCDIDLNWDGALDCILSSRQFFLVIDPRGGRLVFAAARVGNEPYELIGSRSQFVVGLGDPLDWRPERGLAGDPQEISGAFANPAETLLPDNQSPDRSSPAPWQSYRFDTRPGEIVVTHPDNGTRKSFRLIEGGFQVSIENQQQGQMQWALTWLPLALLDQNTYLPGGYARYRSLSPTQTGSWGWSLGGVQVLVTIRGADGIANSFVDSSSLLTKPEDPR